MEHGKGAHPPTTGGRNGAKRSLYLDKNDKACQTNMSNILQTICNLPLCLVHRHLLASQEVLSDPGGKNNNM